MALPQRDPVAASRRIAMVAANAEDFARERGPLARALAAQGHRVLCLTPGMETASGVAKALSGCETAAIAFSTGRLEALADRRSVDALAARFGEWKPNIVVGFGFKPMLLAAVAGKRAGASLNVLVADDLSALGEEGHERLGFSQRWLMRRGLKAANALVVHNADHAQRLAALGVLPAHLAPRVIAGAGVDLSAWQPAPLPPVEPAIVFAMAAWRDREKGLLDFCEAARRVRARTSAARFVLASAPGRGTGEVPPSALEQYAGAVDLVPWPEDARELLAATHVAVVPSWGEGLAQRAVEALACGRPVITADAPGCRDTVDERVNGVVVPPRDPAALAVAMESFIGRPEQLVWMSRAARAKAERRFDASRGVSELLDVMGLGRRG